MSNQRKRIIANAIKKQEMLINDFKQRIKDALLTDGNVNEEGYDNQQKAFQSQVLSEVDLLNEEIKFAAAELADLQKIETHETTPTTAVFGAIVRTDKKTFLICASLEEFQVDNREFFGISMRSPIYNAMRGKKVGDKFHYNNVQYTIQEIY